MTAETILMLFTLTVMFIRLCPIDALITQAAGGAVNPIPAFPETPVGPWDHA